MRRRRLLRVQVIAEMGLKLLGRTEYLDLEDLLAAAEAAPMIPSHVPDRGARDERASRMLAMSTSSAPSSYR